MKKTFLMIVLTMLLSMSGTLAYEGGWDYCEARQVTAFENPNNFDFIYTTSPEEKQALRNAGWYELSETYSWWAPPVGQPIYRIWNTVNGRHLYTMDENEVRILTTERGWIADNNGEAVYCSDGTYPIYRIYDFRYGYHMLEPSDDSASIYNTYRNMGGWRVEGIGFYGYRDVWGN